jgi:hypothetical protein
MATLNNVDQDLISRIMIVAQFLHDHETDLADANVQYDAVGTGLKDRLAALPNGGQDALDELGGLNGMTVSELNDIAYVVTTQTKDTVTAARVALAAVRKVT